jgi:RNA polymerase sigma-70 factor (ECF subfamily)
MHAALSPPDRVETLGGAFRRLGPALYAQALAIVADPATAEDVVQDAFVRVWRRRERLADLSTLDGYLFTAVRHLALDEQRRGQRAMRRVLAAAPSPTLGGDGPDVERIDEALRGLPPEQREVVVLRVHLGLSFAEVAERTLTPLGTVHSRYRYAMTRLRERLLEVYDVAEIIAGTARDRGGFHLDPDLLIELLELCPAVHEGQYSAEVSNGTLIMRASEAGLAETTKLLRYLSGAQPEPTTAPEPAWVRDLKARFERPATLDFTATRLSEVVDRLQELTGANITVSPAVDQEETTVDLQVRDLPLHEALRLILEQTHLASAFRNETLMICPPEDARGELRLRIVDTRDLEAWLLPDVLEGIVTRGVGEDAWDEPAWIRSHHEQLLVHQTDEVHAAIDQVLAKLRVSRARNQAGQGR